MSLLSLFQKKQETSTDTDEGEFRSRAEEETRTARGRGKKGQAADPMLPEKKRARRRLIGAVALALAAVIFLPMILDSEPKLRPDDISIQIPSKDKPQDDGAAAPAPKVSDASQLPAASAAANAVPPAVGSDKNKPEAKEEIVDAAALNGAGKPAAKEPAKEPTAKEPVAIAAASKQAAEAKPAPEYKADKTDGKPAKTVEKSGAESKAEAKPAKAKPADGDEEARAMAILEGKAPPKAAAKDKAGSYVVQVATLSTQEKVDELQEKLKSAGIKSYTQKVATASGDKTRIRVGPFESKEEADKMHAKLGKLGLNGTLVPAN